MWRKILIGLVLFVFMVWAWNSSLLADQSGNQTRLLAHRGVHQTFSFENLENDTCTANRIYGSDHGFFENTLPSMQAAFGLGAEVVDMDIHLTTDGQFAVFHDWTLDCRTDGSGVTRDLDMASLRALDVGYGYTFDGGATFPLRGTGIGMMPSLIEVFEAFPDRKFLINFKSGVAEEGDALSALMLANPEWQSVMFGVYGGAVPTQATFAQLAGSKGDDRKTPFACLGTYLAIGWTGIVPGACANMIIAVPTNYAWLM